MADFSVAIMAGGRSSRMGQNKALMPIHGKPLFEHVLSAVTRLAPYEIIISTNAPTSFARWDLPKIPDDIPDKGPMGGIMTVLRQCARPDVLVVACDMPFLNPDLLRVMLDLRDDAVDIIVPSVAGRPQCLHAVYNRRCLPVFEACLQADKLKLARAYADLRVRYLPEDDWRPYDPVGRSFFNANTPDDLDAALHLMQGK